MANDKNLPPIKCKLEINTELYWNIYDVLSYNAFFNISMGGRGIGKTFQCLIWAINRCIKYNEEFIYVRRYKSETKDLKTLLDTFIDGVTFVGDGNDGGTWYYGKKVIGYLKALSVAQNFKSKIFDKVKTIIYDEAIIRQTISQRYLKNEITLLLEFVSTVFRNRLGGRVFILGNNLDFFNPYFTFFEIKIFKKRYYDKERKFYVEYCDTQAQLLKIEETTPLYALTKGTQYHDYHYNNKVLTNNQVSIDKKRANDKLYIRFVVNNYTINIYQRDNDRWFVETKNKVINDDYSIKIIENDEYNLYYIMVTKKKYLRLLSYNYYNKLIDYGDDDSSILLNLIIDAVM